MKGTKAKRAATKAKPQKRKAKPAVAKAKLLKFDEFLKAIPKKARIAIFFDTDPDGITSAVIAAKAIQAMRGRPPEEIVPVHHGDFGNIEKIASKYKFDIAIVLDLPLDSILKAAKALEKKCRILNIDHHKFYCDIFSGKTLLLKAHMLSKKEPSRYPTSKMCFDLFSRKADVSEADWLAAIGIIGDHAWDEWDSFLEKTAKHWKMKKKEFFELNNIMEAFLSMNAEGASEIFGFLARAKGPKELFKSRFASQVEEFESELEKEFEIAKRKSERYEKANLIFYCFRTKFNIKNALIAKMSDLWPEKNIIVVEDSAGDTIKASARRQDFKLSMGELMENAVKGIEGARGGGHVPAAGATMPRKSLGKFKAELIRILSKKEA